VANLCVDGLGDNLARLVPKAGRLATRDRRGLPVHHAKRLRKNKFMEKEQEKIVRA
jgi:hypothetical protein